MDLNLVVLSGSVTTEPELSELTDGTRSLRLLVTVRSEQPRRRVEVIPVTLWDPPRELLEEATWRSRPVWVIGALHRRMRSAEAGRRSRIEVIAHHVELRDAVDVERGGERHGAA